MDTSFQDEKPTLEQQSFEIELLVMQLCSDLKHDRVLEETDKKFFLIFSIVIGVNLLAVHGFIDFAEPHIRRWADPNNLAALCVEGEWLVICRGEL